MKKMIKYSVILLLLVTSISVTAEAQDTKVKVLLLSGTGNLDESHPYSHWDHAYYNDILIDHIKDFAEVTITTDLKMFTKQGLAPYDIVISNALFQNPGKEQFQAFLDFVESGKPYFAIHTALVAFSEDYRYQQLLGAQYVHHDNPKMFTVNTYDSWYDWERQGKKKHPITKGLEDFKILDELYLMQGITDDLEVIARAEYHPVMWWRNYGKGRVLVFTLGHGDYSQTHEGFKSLFRNGVLWLTKGLE